MNLPLILYSWPRAIVHIDGDAFFASCEQALNPSFRGKPVVTGYERGIAAAISYEAKKFGIKRAMTISEVKKRCPQCIIVPSDYQSYSLISHKMFEIMRKTTPMVEEYSIDEGFADITGLRRPLNMSYNKIAKTMKDNIEESLGISVSVGVSINKSLAKLSSNFQKPSGLTVVPGYKVHLLLGKIKLRGIWGMGPNTTAYLNKFGIRTALDLASKTEEFIVKKLTKPGYEIWQELRGHYTYKIDPKAKTTYKSISKVQTFSPPSSNKSYIYARLIHNLERACAKARRYGLAAKEIVFFLKKQDFKIMREKLRLTRPSVNPFELAPLIKKQLGLVFEHGVLYRATGIILVGLRNAKTTQFSLFDDMVSIKKTERVFDASISINKRFGRGSIFLGPVVSMYRNKKSYKHRKTIGVPTLSGEAI